MKNKLTVIFCSTLALCFLLNISAIRAQEVISGLNGNPLLKKYYSEQKNKKTKSLTDTLELPFFDEFSDSYFYPDPYRWTDNYAFINGTYASYPDYSPPSLGVATLDAINNNGEFYDAAGYGNYFSADTLSSSPINLEFPGDNSVYLSFYYQPQGLGDAPEERDSLIVEFYAPADMVWEKVWDITGSENAPFQHVMLHITDDKFLKKGFRFRFRNIASLSGDKHPSQVINADHWHIDYVYLNRGRTSTDVNPNDIAFVYPMASALKYYEAMPWKHFLAAPTSELATNVKAIYQNNHNNIRLVDSIYFVFYDNSGNEPNDTLFGGSYNMSAGQQRTLDPPFTYPFLTNTTDSASFTIKAKLVTDDADFKANNEMYFIQRFYDYYAYDDGTAEASYGLTGDGAQNARLAYKFDCKKQDTLKAVQMYFNRSLNDQSKKYFYLTIWDDNEGVPGQIIYQREALQPEYENELNKFHTYYINDTVLVLNRVFYVGWIQTTSDMLNIGLDLNRDRNDYIFYNINGIWENSKFDAALMIRPFFGKNLSLALLPEPKKTTPDIEVYPNPTNGSVTIDIKNFSDFRQIELTLYTLSGRQVYQSYYKENTIIDISELKEGIYLLRLTDKTKKLNYSARIIKTR